VFVSCREGRKLKEQGRRWQGAVKPSRRFLWRTR
jgi:hypothetical protein